MRKVALRFVDRLVEISAVSSTPAAPSPPALDSAPPTADAPAAAAPATELAAALYRRAQLLRQLGRLDEVRACDVNKHVCAFGCASIAVGLCLNSHVRIIRNI